MLKRPAFAGWFLVMPPARESLAGAIHITPGKSDLALWHELRAAGQLTAAAKLAHLLVQNIIEEE